MSSATDRSGRLRTFVVRELKWFLPTLLIGLIAAVLYTLGEERAGWLIEILALIAAIVTPFLVEHLRPLIGSRTGRRGGPSDEATTPQDQVHQAGDLGRARWIRGTLALASLLLLVVLLNAVQWWHDNRSDLHVEFGTPTRLSPEGSAALVPVIDGEPLRGSLTFTPEIRALSTAGNCVVPAVLDIRPVVDGRPGGLVRARHDQFVEIPVGSDVRSVELEITYRGVVDPSCLIEVTLADGHLDR
ncbi:hypothetical protein [Plantactinospora sp. B24E8]|uniref:hypothetical protein n=1 Tax=Plantactinospora sp. B24E8 TaxID=3153567 RepID=UPI00325D9157